MRITLNQKIPLSVLPWLFLAFAISMLGIDIAALQLDMLVQEGTLPKTAVGLIYWSWLLLNLGAWYVMLPGRYLLKTGPAASRLRKPAIAFVSAYWLLTAMGWTWLIIRDTRQ